MNGQQNPDRTARTVNATEFKARCLEILDQLAARELTHVTVTKRGRVVAVLNPPPAPPDATLHGCMRGTVAIPPESNPAAFALDEPLAAEHGILHR